MNNKINPIDEKTAVITEENDLLIKKAKQGDPAAFRKLYDGNVDRVYAVCLRITANPRTAKSLTQDVFVKAWENIYSFRGEALFSTWLHRIAVNTSLMELQSKKKRSIFVSLTEKISIVKKEPEKFFDIEKAIASLPSRARAVFVLHDVEGYKHEEISRMMDTSPGTCKAQLHRARKLLREFMRDEL